MDITPEQYISALQNLLPSESKKIQNGFKMLKANYRAENMTISATKLAKAGGYNSYQIGNEQYGSFAHKISDLLDVKPEGGNSDIVTWTFIICNDYGEKDKNGHFQWTLKPEVAEAIEKMKLVEPVSRLDLFDEIDNKSQELSTEPEKTRKAVIKARIGQGLFRERLINHWEGCSVTGFSNTDFLIASHIKPWKDCSTGEALDVTNGLLLLPNIDRVFDKGFISFDKAGDIMISPQIDSSDIKALGLVRDMKLRWCYSQHNIFLEYHREHVFKSTE